jgi:hypothetical protein
VEVQLALAFYGTARGAWAACWSARSCSWLAGLAGECVPRRPSVLDAPPVLAGERDLACPVVRRGCATRRARPLAGRLSAPQPPTGAGQGLLQTNSGSPVATSPCSTTALSADQGPTAAMPDDQLSDPLGRCGCLIGLGGDVPGVDGDRELSVGSSGTGSRVRNGAGHLGYENERVLEGPRCSPACDEDCQVEAPLFWGLTRFRRSPKKSVRGP